MSPPWFSFTRIADVYAFLRLRRTHRYLVARLGKAPDEFRRGRRTDLSTDLAADVVDAQPVFPTIREASKAGLGRVLMESPVEVTRTSYWQAYSSTPFLRESEPNLRYTDEGKLLLEVRQNTSLDRAPSHMQAMIADLRRLRDAGVQGHVVVPVRERLRVSGIGTATADSTVEAVCRIRTYHECDKFCIQRQNSTWRSANAEEG